MKTFVTLAIAISLFLTVSTVQAQYGPYEGDISSPDILVDKLVGVPHEDKGENVTVDFTDNLGSSDHKFKPQSFLFFKIKVKNTSNRSLANVTVKDFAPELIEVFDNPGTFDAASRTLTISAGDFDAGQEKEWIVRARVKPQDQLPADRGLICLVNQAKAENNEVADNDASSFCIEKTVLGVESIPSAGAGSTLAILTGAISAAFIGLKLRKTRI